MIGSLVIATPATWSRRRRWPERWADCTPGTKSTQQPAAASWLPASAGRTAADLPP